MEDQAVIEFEDGKVWLLNEEMAGEVKAELKRRFGTRPLRSHVDWQKPEKWPKGYDIVHRPRLMEDRIENESGGV